MSTVTPSIERTLPLALRRGAERGLALPTSALRAGVMLVDATIVSLALLAATAVRLAPNEIDADRLPAQIAVACALMIAGLAAHGAYEFQRVRNGQEVLMRIATGVIVGLGLMVLASFVFPPIALGRGVFALVAAFAGAMLLGWRRVLFTTLRELALRPRALILGEGPLACKVAAALGGARYGGAEVVGMLVPGRAALAAEGAGGPPLLGTYARLRELVARLRISHAVVIGGSRDESLPLEDLLALRKQGLVIEDGAAAYEDVTGKLLIEKLTPGWLMFANALERSAIERVVRRVIEGALAAVLLIFLAPVLAAVALAVKLDSPGPAIFRQRRVGEGGRTFEVLKFRTMRQDAEAKTGAVWAKENDPRVTRLGRILRATRLDELPQLWNVLRGDMFFVGPRPERPEFVELLSREIPHYDHRHAVKPGITGWAQINYRYGASIADAEEKLRYDLYYVQNRSVLLDVNIILGTIRVMLGAENSS